MGFLVVWQHRRVLDVPLTRAFELTPLTDFDDTLVHTARGLGICLGDGKAEPPAT